MALNVGELFLSIELKEKVLLVARRVIKAVRDMAKDFGSKAGDMGKRAAAMGVQIVALGLKFAMFAASAALAAHGVIALGAALAPAVGIIAAWPGVIALGAAAMVTLRVALLGVGDAFKAALGADPKKFQEAIAGLSPAARSAALELRALKPAFDGLKASVQDSFFAPLAGQIRAVAASLIGPLRDGMSGVAAQFGLAAAEVAKFGASAQSASAVTKIFGSLRDAVSTLRPAIQPVLAGFRDIAVVGAQFSTGLAPGIADAAAKFGQFLSKAAASGQALAWMDAAMQVFKALGAVAADVAGILKAVFSAMQSGGTGALGVVGQLLDKFNAFLNSAQGQQILVTIFGALQQVGQAIFPVFESLGRALALIAPQIANIARALGPGLSAAVDALGPALAALGPGLTVVADQLAKAFASPELQAGLLQLGKGISDTLIAVAPLLPVIAQLAGILGQYLGIALSNLAALLKPVIGALVVALRPALTSISDALTQLAPLMPPIYDAFGQIAAALISQLLPPLLQLIPSILTDLVPALVLLMQSLLPLLPTLTQLAVKFVNEVLPAILPIIPQLLLLGAGFAKFGAKVLAVAQQIKPYLDIAVSAFQWMYNVLVGHSIVPDMVNKIGQWIGTTLLGFFRNLGSKITGAVGNIGPILSSIGRNIVSGIWQGILGQWGPFYSQVQSFFSGIVDSVKNALGIHSPSRVFASIGQFMMRGLSRGIDKTSGLVTSSLNRVASLAAKTALPDLTVPGVTVPDRVAGGAGGWARTVVNVTNHYPQAEPTSVSINKGLQYVGALGV
ncbi:hypothetical protein GCM10023194_80770 [Planotetraspora phitsanulokensis]|uniref:Phage-related protein n=1 Tax=Planotetraspora phitsanulokensis TaxID=575192 RepID=A0A8J3UEA7_9ACTN|nr:hypothetical protein [Planotetraspora phitsanulokensis]GII42926.1 hypothetical protein Pph01_79290 [Planotetraspora phitsanulokensis]